MRYETRRDRRDSGELRFWPWRVLIAARRRGTCPATLVAAVGSDGHRPQSLGRDAGVVGRGLCRRARLYGAGRIASDRYSFGATGLASSLSHPPTVALARRARS